MQIVLSTESLKGYGLNRVFRFAKEAGFDGIDLAMENGNYDTLDDNYIKELSDALTLPVVAVQTPKATSKTKIQEAIRMAKKLGSRIVVIQPPKLLDRKLVTWLKKEIPKMRQKENISIALENAPSKTMFGFLPEHAMNSMTDLKAFKHVCLDTSRTAEKKEDLIKIYSSLKKYLVHEHLSNVYKNKPYAPPETGSLPIESFLSKLKGDKFKGAISIRVKPKHFHPGNEDKMMDDLKSSLKFCRKYLEE